MDIFIRSTAALAIFFIPLDLSWGAELADNGPLLQLAGQMQSPGEIRKPGEIQVPRGLDTWPKVKPADQWQVPGEIQKPGDIQVPGDIQGVKVLKETCEQRLVVAADSLFEFDKDMLTPSATASLEKLGPTIKAAATYGVRIEGHTDGKGGDDYNQKLSERRAGAVRSWLLTRQFLPASTTVAGFGKRKPVAPNTNPNGSDNPEGRALNRRVELIFLTCK